MTRLLIVFYLITQTLVVQAQYFSGEITYQTSFIPKSDTVDIQEIKDNHHGTESTYLITANHYKSTYFKNGTYTYSYIYHDSTKRMYDDYARNLYVTYRDSRLSNGHYTKPLIYNDSTINVLGHESYLVVKESERGKTKSYYSDDIKVNYKNFKGHKVGNWYENLKVVDGAIALKSITEHDQYFEVREAVKIEEREVETSEFYLPNKPIAASFSALDDKIELKKPTEEQIYCYREKVANVSKPDGEEFVVYVKFLLRKDGGIEYIEPLEEDEFGFYKTAVDIILYCGLEFIPGKIEGKRVNAQMYFPVVFLN